MPEKVKNTQKRTVGIIGGHGKMGAWFANFFSKLGVPVLCSDVKQGLSKQELIAKSEVILVSVPISTTVKVIEEIISELSEQHLVADLTSLKVKPLAAMLKSKAEVLGLHPMFGPSTESMQGQKIVVCSGRKGTLAGWLLGLLESGGASLCEVNAEKHDYMMAVIQGLNHFSSIALGAAHKELGFDLKDGQNFASPIYRIRMDMVGRILAQDPELYADIELQNPEIGRVLDVFMKCAEDLVAAIKQGDRAAFLKIFNGAAEYFDDVAPSAMESTEQLIKIYSGK